MPPDRGCCFSPSSVVGYGEDGLVFNDPPYPVSAACPQCGGTRYRELPAWPPVWRWLWKDRLCPDCRIRYTPPTPAGLMAAYLVSGALVSLGLLTCTGFALAGTEPPVWLGDLCPPVMYLASLVFLLSTQWHASFRMHPTESSRQD